MLAYVILVGVQMSAFVLTVLLGGLLTFLPHDANAGLYALILGSGLNGKFDGRLAYLMLMFFLYRLLQAWTVRLAMRKNGTLLLVFRFLEGVRK